MTFADMNLHRTDIKLADDLPKNTTFSFSKCDSRDMVRFVDVSKKPKKTRELNVSITDCTEAFITNLDLSQVKWSSVTFKGTGMSLKDKILPRAQKLCYQYLTELVNCQYEGEDLTVKWDSFDTAGYPRVEYLNAPNLKTLELFVTARYPLALETINAPQLDTVHLRDWSAKGKTLKVERKLVDYSLFKGLRGKLTLSSFAEPLHEIDVFPELKHLSLGFYSDAICAAPIRSVFPNLHQYSIYTNGSVTNRLPLVNATKLKVLAIYNQQGSKLKLNLINDLVENLTQIDSFKFLDLTGDGVLLDLTSVIRPIAHKLTGLTLTDVNLDFLSWRLPLALHTPNLRNLTVAYNTVKRDIIVRTVKSLKSLSVVGQQKVTVSYSFYGLWNGTKNVRGNPVCCNQVWDQLLHHSSHTQLTIHLFVCKH